jgi:hypothetical protein
VSATPAISNIFIDDLCTLVTTTARRAITVRHVQLASPRCLSFAHSRLVSNVIGHAWRTQCSVPEHITHRWRTKDQIWKLTYNSDCRQCLTLVYQMSHCHVIIDNDKPPPRTVRPAVPLACTGQILHATVLVVNRITDEYANILEPSAVYIYILWSLSSINNSILTRLNVLLTYVSNMRCDNRCFMNIARM